MSDRDVIGRAIHEHDANASMSGVDWPTWDELGDEGRAAYRQVADDVLDALRESHTKRTTQTTTDPDPITRYQERRQLLGKENDTEALWACITAADAAINTLLNTGRINRATLIDAVTERYRAHNAHYHQTDHTP